MVDVRSLTTEVMRRRVLLEEGVLRGAATASDALLDMFWRARESDEYQERLRAISIRMEGLPSLIVCHGCGRSAPGVDQLADFPDDPEVSALRAGWRHDEEYLWMCLRCLGEP